ncbi:M20/M25/M40 family metallo-hydrolase [Actinoplanes sp. NPDC048988]|uniref:M20/M25/M40 family metallo-hydrolase n=1 Tax=Actinoplanes sp. NPDC048988 TaxID=3363901 RepID=UPI0037106B81
MDVIETLRRYTLIETPTGDRASLDALAEVLEADAARAGFHTGREDGHLLWSRPGRAGRPLLFLSHYDTVWPVGTLRDMPWLVEDDTIKGPGVYDTKSGLAALLAAASRAGHDGPEIRVLVVADEEIGSPTATGLVRSEAAKAAAVFGMEPPHPDGALKTGRRGSTRARIEVTGIESHAALDPDAGVNAIDELLDQLLRVREFVRPRPVLLNVGTIEGGGRTNVVAGHAHADLGLRFLDPDNEEAVLQALTDLVPVRERARVRSTLLAHRATWRPNEAGAALLARVAEVAATIGQSLDGRPADGAADTNTTGAQGIPTVDGLAPRGGGAHARHEWVSAAGIAERVALLEALIGGW